MMVMIESQIFSGRFGLLTRKKPNPSYYHKIGNVFCSKEIDRLEDVKIRKRPPLGISNQPCGPIGFTVKLGEINNPRNILEEIIWNKTKEIDNKKQRVTTSALSAKLKFCPPTKDFKGVLQTTFSENNHPALIAEAKKASPSRGIIQSNFDPIRIAKEYESGGASCISVLTDETYFQGSFENLKAISQADIKCPLLCKEFIIDAYQLMLARLNGADAVLLIAAVLDNKDLIYFIKSSQTLGLQCLIEVHDENELNRVLELESIEKHMIGINNRNLETFEVDKNVTHKLLNSETGKKAINRGIFMISESGIFNYDDMKYIQQAGCKAALVGEAVVKNGNFKDAVFSLLNLPDKN